MHAGRDASAPGAAVLCPSHQQAAVEGRALLLEIRSVPLQAPVEGGPQRLLRRLGRQRPHLANMCAPDRLLCRQHTQLS